MDKQYRLYDEKTDRLVMIGTEEECLEHTKTEPERKFYLEEVKMPQSTQKYMLQFNCQRVKVEEMPRPYSLQFSWALLSGKSTPERKPDGSEVFKEFLQFERVDKHKGVYIEAG